MTICNNITTDSPKSWKITILATYTSYIHHRYQDHQSPLSAKPHQNYQETITEIIKIANHYCTKSLTHNNHSNHHGCVSIIKITEYLTAITKSNHWNYQSSEKQITYQRNYHHHWCHQNYWKHHQNQRNHWNIITWPICNVTYNLRKSVFENHYHYWNNCFRKVVVRCTLSLRLRDAQSSITRPSVVTITRHVGSARYYHKRYRI